MTEVRRFVPRNLRDDGMIEAHEVAHYTHLNLSQYVSASDYAALAARVQAVEDMKTCLERGISAQGALVDDLRQQLADMTRERDEAQERYEKQCEGTMSRLQEIQSVKSERDCYKQQLAEAQGTVQRLTDRIDLQCDEFQRISALTENDEIKGLCARAVKDIRQHVPVIQQRDQADQQVARLRETLTKPLPR